MAACVHSLSINRDCSRFNLCASFELCLTSKEFQDHSFPSCCCSVDVFPRCFKMAEPSQPSTPSTNAMARGAPQYVCFSTASLTWTQYIISTVHLSQPFTVLFCSLTKIPLFILYLHRCQGPLPSNVPLPPFVFRCRLLLYRQKSLPHTPTCCPLNASMPRRATAKAGPRSFPTVQTPLVMPPTARDFGATGIRL